MLAVLAGGEISQAVAEGFLVKEENHMSSLVNEHRTAHGKPGMRQDPALQMVARRQAQRMSAAGYIQHNPNLGAEAGGAVPNWLRIGENVGVGSSVVRVQDAFLGSATHHSNIDASYNLIGLGVVPGDSGSLYVTQNFAQVDGGPPTLVPQALPATPAPPAPLRGNAPSQQPASRGQAARRAPLSRVLSIESPRPGAGAAQHRQSGVSFVNTVVGMLKRAGGKLRFWG